jgi:hypothetical protein
MVMLVEMLVLFWKAPPSMQLTMPPAGAVEMARDKRHGAVGEQVVLPGAVGEA